MSLSISQLYDRVTVQFPDAEQVDDSIIRFTKKMGEQPYAVYYLDITQSLPDSQEELTAYQDRTIGSHYFEGSKSLQWSTYLYFITNYDSLKSDEMNVAKELIERDRSYARKFVIPEDELELILSPQVISQEAAAPHAGILSIWTNHLIEANLDRAILSDDDLPTRLSLIESTTEEPKPITKIQILPKEIDQQPFIRSLSLNKFRKFPSQRSFDFGRVNLIFGRNGSGKTSLLEAIELFYCGRNKRNRAANSMYSLAVDFIDGSSEKATHSRAPQVFRNRNLIWYGQPEVKTNNLYQSFSQFNFLDTDAAVGLADSTSHIEDDLSKLLVGPEASKVWRNIGRVSDEIEKHLKGLKPLKDQIKGELRLLEIRLSEASSVNQESDLIRERLKSMVDRVGWNSAQEDKETISLIEPLAELEAIAHQAINIEWITSPISMQAMVSYCRDAELASKKVSVDQFRLEFLRKEQRKLEVSINRDRQALSTVKQLLRYIDADLVSRAVEFNKLQTDVDTMSGPLTGIDTNTLKIISASDLEVSLATLHEGLKLKRYSAC